MRHTTKPLKSGCSLSLSVSPSHATAQTRPVPPHSSRFYTTHDDTPQSVGLLWTRDRPVAQTT